MTQDMVDSKNNTKKTWYELFLSKTTINWLEEKRKIDDLNGLWRIHDNLYDVTDFIDKHPGGRFWLEETKGLDITEAFETHHIRSDAAEIALKKYFIKKATKPRLSIYTFHENGFYKTLKRKVREVLKTLPKDSHKLSDMYTDSLFIATIILSCLANAYSVYTFAILASFLCSLLLGACHNYSHQRDNLRMLYGDCFMVSARGFRIVHVLSHHAFANTHNDLQVTFGLPLVNFFPEKKSFIVKWLAWITSTFITFPFTLPLIGLAAFVECITLKKNYVTAVAPFALPLIMYCTGGTLLSTIGMWLVILIATGTFFATISFTTTHIHPDLYMEGDAIRPKEELDWGISQLDTIYDRTDIMGYQFLTLVLFGDHVVHHLFPTLDHSYLKYLYPILEETLKEFNIGRMNLTTTADLYLGYFRQSAREVPKLTPPSLKKFD